MISTIVHRSKPWEVNLPKTWSVVMTQIHFSVHARGSFSCPKSKGIIDPLVVQLRFSNEALNYEVQNGEYSTDRTVPNKIYCKKRFEQRGPKLENIWLIVLFWCCDNLHCQWNEKNEKGREIRRKGWKVRIMKSVWKPRIDSAQLSAVTTLRIFIVA